MLCILETGARGGQEASDGNRTHSFRILMRCGADYSDARVRHIHTHARSSAHIHNLHLCDPCHDLLSLAFTANIL